jgi:hypothetical protein
MVALCFGSSALGSPALTVTITSAPPPRSTSAAATFAFSANEPATLACSLDGGNPAECRSPKSYGQTKQICFESFTAVLVSFFYSPCAIPKTSNLLLSTNG